MIVARVSNAAHYHDNHHRPGWRSPVSIEITRTFESVKTFGAIRVQKLRVHTHQGFGTTFREPQVSHEFTVLVLP